MVEDKLTFIQPVSETDVSKGQSSLETPTSSEEAARLDKLRSITSSKSSGRSRSTASSSTSAPSAPTPEPQSVDESSTREQFISGATPEPEPVSQAPKTQTATSQRIQREELFTTTTKVLTKPRSTLREGAIESKQFIEEKLTDTSERRRLLARRKASSKDTFDLKSDVKAFIGGAALAPIETTILITTPPKKIADPISQDIVTFFKGKEQTEIGKSLKKQFDDPSVLFGTIAVGLGAETTIFKVTKPKPVIISQEGKITSIKTSALPEQTTIIKTEDLVTIQRGRETIKAKISGEGRVSPEIDDVLIGFQERQIEFISEKGKPLGSTTERADFNIRELEGGIRAEGSTLTIDPKTGKTITGRFQSTKTSLPDESFVNRIISGSTKKKSFQDITPDIETIGFQKQQFEITQPVNIDIELAPGFKITKEAIETRSVDLTTSSGVKTKTSAFEKDFLKRKELLTTEKKAFVKVKKDDPLLGPIIVQDDTALFAQSVFKPKKQPSKNFFPQETVTVTKKSVKQKVTTSSLPSTQILKALPETSTQTTGLGPIGTITTSSLPRIEKPTTIIKSSVQSIKAPSSEDLQRAFIPPKTKPLVDNKPTVSKLIVQPQPITIPEVKTITKQKGKGKTKTLPETIVKLDLAQSQLQKQQTKQLQKQELKSLQGSPSRIKTTTPSIVFPLPIIFKQKPAKQEFSVQVRRKGKFQTIFKTSSEEIAFRTGISEARGRAVVSTRVLQDGIVIDPTRTFQGFKVSKKEKGVLIEESKSRIDSPGELAEITLKGIRSDKKKKKKKKKSLFF